MSLWKKLLLGLYYHASMPVRWWDRHCRTAEHRVPLIVVYYHRISDDCSTPWTLPSEMFIRQVGWLQRHFELISLDETRRRILSGSNDRPAVSITFDDGYSENCRIAIPWLVKHRVPCTYFVTARNVLECRPFDHDLARGLDCPPNSIEELRAMAAAGIEIGSHTYTHADLGRISDPRLLQYELVAAGKDIEAALGRPMRYFAFPFGQYVNLNPAAFELAHKAGYQAVCSAYGGVNFPGDDAFHLQRIPADDSMIRLKNWVTGDPRKRAIPRFQYDNQPWEQDAKVSSRP